MREEHAILHHKKEIERVTGGNPATCPWRVFNDPIVQEVLKYRWAYDPPNLEAAWGPDPLNILVEAMGVYSRAVNSTKSEEQKLEEQKRKQNRK